MSGSARVRDVSDACVLARRPAVSLRSRWAGALCSRGGATPAVIPSPSRDSVTLRTLISGTPDLAASPPWSFPITSRRFSRAVPCLAVSCRVAPCLPCLAVMFHATLISGPRPAPLFVPSNTCRLASRRGVFDRACASPLGSQRPCRSEARAYLSTSRAASTARAGDGRRGLRRCRQGRAPLRAPRHDAPRGRLLQC